MERFIPIISLIIAVLSVFVGPFISSRIANKSLLVPIHQKWVNEFRDIISELSAKALHYYVSGFEERKDSEYLDLEVLRQKAEFLITPHNKIHSEFIQVVSEMIDCINDGSVNEKFKKSHIKMKSLGQSIIKEKMRTVGL